MTRIVSIFGGTNSLDGLATNQVNHSSPPIARNGASAPNERQFIQELTSKRGKYAYLIITVQPFSFSLSQMVPNISLIRAVDHTGKIDVLVNNAGSAQYGPLQPSKVHAIR